MHRCPNSSIVKTATNISMAAETPRCKSPYADAFQLQIQYSCRGSTPQQTLVPCHVPSFYHLVSCLAHHQSSQLFSTVSRTRFVYSFRFSLYRLDASTFAGDDVLGSFSRLWTCQCLLAISLHVQSHTSEYSSRLLRHRTSATTCSAEYPNTTRLCHIRLDGTSG